MMHYAITDENGLIVEVGTAQSLPAGALEVSTQQAANLAALCTMMIVAGSLVVRPTLPPITISGAVATLPVYPARTLVEIFDLAGEERIYSASGTGNEVFDLADAGDYEISITPPSPYLPETHRIIVP